MPITLDNSLATETANSYASVAYADDYWANHFSSIKSAQWDALSPTQKTQALVRACQVIETIRFTHVITLPEYALHYDRRTGTVMNLNITREPVKYFYYQRLQFPRNIDVYVSTPAQVGNQPNPQAPGTLYIPEPVLIAQCEQALYLLNLDETPIANRLQGITLDKVAIGRGQIDTTQEYAVTGSMVAPVALEMLRPLMVRNSKVRRA